MEDTARIWLIKRRHEDISVTFRTVWDIYIKFYTVFLTFNVAALGIFAVRLSTSEGLLRPLRMLALAFVIQNILTAITSAGMVLYTRNTTRAQKELETELLGGSAQTGPETAIPQGLATWGGSANSLAMLGMAAVWVYIMS